MMLALVLTTVLSQGYYSPQEAASLFAQGNEAFAKEDFPGATDAFQKLMDHGWGGPDVLYNLGTAYLAQGDVGYAVLELERARKAGGAAPDLDANLALARSHLLDQVVGGGADEGLLPRLALSASSESFGIAFCSLWALGFTLLVSRRLLPRIRLPLTAFVAISSLSLAVPVGAIYGAHLYAQRAVREAVVVAKNLPAHEAPQSASKVSFEVHAGLRVRLLDQAGEFVRVRLPNGLEGWMEKSGVVAI
jgi:hypothetical protein